MIRCQACGTNNQDSSKFCDECGSGLVQKEDIHRTDMPSVRQNTAETPIFSGSNVTSVGIPAIVEQLKPEGMGLVNGVGQNETTIKATLVIERGDANGTEFIISREESTIGRWDADNGIFPDIDLDSHDQEAKVSRRHARILAREGRYFIEDLGSTNGTYVNRGRRLLPGTPQAIADGDEIIVGKTFLRFRINH